MRFFEPIFAAINKMETKETNDEILYDGDSVILSQCLKIKVSPTAFKRGALVIKTWIIDHSVGLKNKAMASKWS